MVSLALLPTTKDYLLVTSCQPGGTQRVAEVARLSLDHRVNPSVSVLKCRFGLFTLPLNLSLCNWMVHFIFLVTDTTDTDKLPPGSLESHNLSVANWSLSLGDGILSRMLRRLAMSKKVVPCPFTLTLLSYPWH